jgi:hypothetical protein
LGTCLKLNYFVLFSILFVHKIVSQKCRNEILQKIYMKIKIKIWAYNIELEELITKCLGLARFGFNMTNI